MKKTTTLRDEIQEVRLVCSRLDTKIQTLESATEANVSFSIVENKLREIGDRLDRIDETMAFINRIAQALVAVGKTDAVLEQQNRARSLAKSYLTKDSHGSLNDELLVPLEAFLK